MKNTILFALLIGLFSGTTTAQNSNPNIAVGDIFIIGEVPNNSYKHIHFPKPNFIIKKGGIVNYKNIKGKKVEITAIKKKKDGSLLATLRFVSKKSFFNSHKYVSADITEAIREKELVTVQE